MRTKKYFIYTIILMLLLLIMSLIILYYYRTNLSVNNTIPNNWQKYTSEELNISLTHPIGLIPTENINKVDGIYKLNIDNILIIYYKDISNFNIEDISDGIELENQEQVFQGVVIENRPRNFRKISIGETVPSENGNCLNETTWEDYFTINGNYIISIELESGTNCINDKVITYGPSSEEIGNTKQILETIKFL